MTTRLSSSIPLNFLVIEDNPGDFFLIKEYIEEMFGNSTISHAVNFQEASDFLSKKDSIFDTILLDVTLPDNQGLDLISDILFLAGNSPVLVLTGYESLDFSIESVSLGVSEYLLKDEISAYALYKSILFGIERKKHFRSVEESEKKYSELFHLSPIPMWVYEMTGLQIIKVNPAAIKQYGYTELEFLNMTVLDLFPDKKAAQKMGFNKERTISSRKNSSHELKNGQRIQVQIEQNYLTIDGQCCCIMLSYNVTELIETQRSLKVAYKNIIEIEENEKEKFAGEIHDGLQQNIVAAKLIFAFMTEQSQSLAEDPRAILLNKTLDITLEDCMQLVKSARPKRIIENGFKAELEDLVEKVNGTGIMEVIYSINADMDRLFAYFDLMHIYRMIQELFNNTLKYAFANKIVMNIKVDGKYVLLTFEDNGKGISNELVEARSSFLSLKRRVQVLGATMKINSAENKGISFEIRIPLKSLR